MGATRDAGAAEAGGGDGGGGGEDGAPVASAKPLPGKTTNKTAISLFMEG
jgi:hypothetical protein